MSVLPQVTQETGSPLASRSTTQSPSLARPVLFEVLLMVKTHAPSKSSWGLSGALVESPTGPVQV
ncbi:MAG: hypothetical protein M5U20_00580 [Phycisphaerales bacterium]|nr:hypothetical protein [Phycisphaerales bacterium]